MTALRDGVREGLLPRYELAGEIGTGGMAAVFRARDTGTNREVAIKVLLPEIARLIGPERFLREIAILRALHHERIMPLLDAGAAAGLPYLVMPWIGGPTLRDAVASAPEGLPLEQVVAVARDVAAAIDYAHARQIMHRDIKPENILLAEGGAMVTDFGLARAIEVAGGDTFSSSGLVLGTAAYMSPEQADASRHVDARTDIYAFGCVLYEMVTGESPFRGPSAQVVLAKHLAETPRRIAIVRPEVPEAMERGILAALSKSPAARPSSAAMLVAMIEGRA